jgi:glycosyltransferase involved in cell wall biosynthesis
MSGEHEVPVISVVIPTYNCARYLGEALESVLAQGMAGVEIIVVDDGSTDETPDVLRAYGERILAVRQVNQGVSAARNHGIRRAKGELVAFLDADDVWLPGKLAMDRRVLADFPDACLVFSDYMAFDGSGVLRGSSFAHDGVFEAWCDARGVRRGEAGAADIFELLVQHDPIQMCSVVARRRCLESAGGFDEGLSVAEDFALFLRLAKDAPVAFVRQVTSGWRYRAEGLSGPRAVTAGRLPRGLLWEEGEYRVLQKLMGELPVPRRRRVRDAMRRRRGSLAQGYARAGRELFWAGEVRGARRLLWKAVRTRPSQAPDVLPYLFGSWLPQRTVREIRQAKRWLTGTS